MDHQPPEAETDHYYNWGKDEGNGLLEEDDFESTVEEPYAMIFLQRLTKLQEASNTLRMKGYYDVSQQYYNADHLYENRNRLYRRLMNEKSKENDARRHG